MSNNLVGNWKNELGSTLKIERVDEENNTFQGKYLTAVGNAVAGEVTGNFHFEEKKSEEGEIIKMFLTTFQVHWKLRKEPDDPPSCTVWCGQGLYENGRTMNKIDTSWLLRRFTTEKNCWNGVTVGKDFFTKQD